MAFDNKIIELLSRKDRAIIKAEKEILEGLSGIEREIYSAVKKQLNKMNKTGGKFEFDEKNTNLVNELDAIIVDSIQKSSYPKSVRDFLQNFDTVTDFNSDIHKKLNDISAKELKDLVDPFKVQTVEDTLQGLTGSGVKTEFVEPIRQELFKNIVAGVNSQDIEASLRELIEGNPEKLGGLERYVSQVTRDSLNQYDGQINAKIADQFGLDAFQYVGSLIGDSRSQCVKWVNKEILLKEDLEREISWAYSNGQGMIPGTNSQNFAVFRGGYNCRHTAVPFKMTEKERERLAEKQDQEEDQTTERNIQEIEKTIESNKKKNPEEKKGELNKNQFLSNRGTEKDKEFLQVFSDSNGSIEIANQYGTNISIRNSSEKSYSATRKFLKDKGRTDLSIFNVGYYDANVEGFCSKTNSYLSVLLRTKDEIKFKKVEGIGKNPFLISEEEVDTFFNENKEKLQLTRTTNVIYKNRFSILQKKNGIWKFFGTSEAASVKLKVGSTNISPTITHESAHLIQNKYDPSLSLSTSVRRKQRELMEKYNLKNFDSVTWYGSTNDSEFFAETYTAYVYNKEGLKAANPDLFQFIEELLFDVYGIDKKTIKIAN